MKRGLILIFACMLVFAKAAMSDHVTDNGLLRTQEGLVLHSGLLRSEETPFGESRKVVDLGQISFANLNLIAFSVFGADISGIAANTGNQFADKRENERQRTEFQQLSDALYHGITPENLTFAVRGAPIQLGNYDFNAKTFEVCIPAIWQTRIQQTFNLNLRELQFLSNNQSPRPCQFRDRNFLSGTLKQQDYSDYGSPIYLQAPNDDIAEQFFESTRTQPLIADVYCGAPYPVRPTSLLKYSIRCEVSYVRVFQNNQEVAVVGSLPAGFPQLSPAANGVNKDHDVAKEPVASAVLPQVSGNREKTVTKVQTELNRVGCSAGTPDGVVGPRTRRAYSNYLSAKQLDAKLYPIDSERLVELVSKDTGIVCRPSQVTKANFASLQGFWKYSSNCGPNLNPRLPDDHGTLVIGMLLREGSSGGRYNGRATNGRGYGGEFNITVKNQRFRATINWGFPVVELTGSFSDDARRFSGSGRNGCRLTFTK